MLKGVKLDTKKKMSIKNEVVDVSNPNKVYVPLINSNVKCECVVKKGKKVKKGTILGIRKDIDFPILSPVSGTVTGFKKCLYLNNEKVECVVISNNKKEQVVKKTLVKDITKYTKEEYITLLKNCGVTGMGGSNFPTFLKYKPDLNFLVVNAVECEPYITSDLMLVKLKAEILLETIDAIMKINNIKACFIGYKKNNNAFLKYISKYPNIILSPVKNMYPMGWERHLIKSTLNLEYKKYPSEIGVVVNNVSTIFSIYKALKFNRCQTNRIVTISGEAFSTPVNVLAKYGTDMSSIVKKIGYFEGDNIRFIAGGPMMGVALNNNSVVVTANLNAITVLNDIEDDEINDCISCGRCLKVCPSRICPVFIMKNIDNKESLKELHPELCVECGLCSYICPSKIGLREAVKKAKMEVMK